MVFVCSLKEQESTLILRTIVMVISLTSAAISIHIIFLPPPDKEMAIRMIARTVWIVSDQHVSGSYKSLRIYGTESSL